MLATVAGVAGSVASESSSSSSLLSSLLNDVKVVGAAWMISSAIFTTYSTTKFLKYEVAHNQSSSSLLSSSKTNNIPLPRPTLLTFFRFVGSLLLGITAHPNLRIMERIHETLDLAPIFALPAFLLFVANYTNSISLNRIGISLTYTSKCAIPLITVLLTIMLDGISSLPQRSALLCLIPIALGIAAASWNSPTFEILGFLSAMISCTAQSALNVSCKRIMTKTGTQGPLAQRAMVAVGILFVSALSFVQVLQDKNSNNDSDKSAVEKLPPLWLTSMAAISYHLEYVLSFVYVKLVSPVTYGASDAVRRLSIIVAGRKMFGGSPFTTLNLCGIALALIGALGYSIFNSR